MVLRFKNWSNTAQPKTLLITLPSQVLKYTAGHINYGGRVTDDWDRRCIMNILEDFYCPAVLQSMYKFSESGIYHQLVPDESDHKVCMYCVGRIKP